VATCRQLPYLHKPAIATVMSLASLVRTYGARSPRSHYDVILIMTSFATELATSTVTEVRTYITYRHVTAFNIQR